MIQFANTKILCKLMSRKKFHKERRLKTYVQLENNQRIMPAKPKEKTLTEFLKLNARVRVLNTLSR